MALNQDIINNCPILNLRKENLPPIFELFYKKSKKFKIKN